MSGVLLAALRRVATWLRAWRWRAVLEVGRDCHIGAGCRFWAPRGIRVGKSCYLGREVTIETNASIGDYVLSGGELAALVLIDAVARLLPGALNDSESAEQDSFMDGLLDCPHYTRPEEIEGLQVPAVLLSGDHAAVARWRRREALGRTWLRRPDLLARRRLVAEDQVLLDEFIREYQEKQGAPAPPDNLLEQRGA